MGKKSTLTAEQRTQLVLRLLSKEEPVCRLRVHGDAGRRLTS